MAIRDSKSIYNAYMRKYHLRRYYAMKHDIIDELGGKCAWCGSVDNLEIDHVQTSNKAFSVSLFLSFSKERVDEEIKKCQLLCKSCHIQKTVEERGQKLARGRHGTLSTYRYCKCDICKTAMRVWSRSYRKKKKPV